MAIIDNIGQGHSGKLADSGPDSYSLEQHQEFIDCALAEITAAGDGTRQIGTVGNLLELAHKIAGSAGIFGHSKLSVAASNLEILCECFAEQGRMPSPENSKGLAELFTSCSTFASGAPGAGT